MDFKPLDARRAQAPQKSFLRRTFSRESLGRLDLRRLLTYVLTLALLATPLGAGLANATNDKPSDPAGAPANAIAATATTTDANEKYEVVYATLNPEGDVGSVYVINRFDVAMPGEITDYGNYLSVLNLTGTSQLAHNGDAVSFTPGTDEFYYQGNMGAADLPWIVDISYYLDNKKTAPSALAGASGALEIRITSRQNTAVDPTFYDNYMLQISVTLDTARCTNLDAPDAMLAEAGKDRVATFTVLPGSDADFTLKAKVTDFVMQGIQITGIPYSLSIEFPDVEDALSDLDELPDAIAELHEGVSILNSNSGQLVQGSAQIKDALFQISAAMNSGQSIDLSQLELLPPALVSLAESLEGLALGVAAVDGAISTIPPGTPLTEADITNLVMYLYGQGEFGLAATATELAQSYGPAQTVRGTYYYVLSSAGMSSLADPMNQMAGGLRSMAGGIESELGNLDQLDQLGVLAAGLNTLAVNYDTFHSGLVAYTAGVDELNNGTAEMNEQLASLPDQIQEEIDRMKQDFLPADFDMVSFTSAKNTTTVYVQFVMQCADIEKPARESEAAPEVKPESLWDRIVALFT